MESRYFKRDISWLSFNYRVLLEAEEIGRASVGKECRSRWSPYH